MLKLAGPTTLVMLIAAVSNVLYTYYVSRLGPDTIAAVSLVFPISLVAMTAMAGGIGGGAASTIARALGGRRIAAATATAEHAFLLAVGIGVAFALLMLGVGRTILGWMGGSGDVLDSATIFAEVIFGGSVITFVGGMFDSVLRGEGNVRVPAIWSSSSLSLQIVLTPLFMFTLGLGLRGAAFATLVSQLLASIPRAWFVLGGRGALKPRFLPRRVEIEPLREILRIGIPASLSTTINYVGIMILTGVVARLGTPDLAAYGLGTRLDFLLLSFAFGVSAAVLTLVGLSVGAGRAERAGRYVRAACSLIVGVLAAAGALLWWRPSLWLGIFTTTRASSRSAPPTSAWSGRPTRSSACRWCSPSPSRGSAGRRRRCWSWRCASRSCSASPCGACTRGSARRAVFATIAAGNVLASLVMAALFLLELRRRGGQGTAATAPG